MINRMPWKRRLYMGLITVSSLIYLTFLLVCSSSPIDRIIVLYTVGVFFLGILYIRLESCHKDKEFGNTAGENYSRFFSGYLFCLFLSGISFFFPGFLQPFFIIGVFLAFTSNTETAFLTITFILLAETAVMNLSVYEIVSGLITGIIGVCLAENIRNKKTRWFTLLISVCVTLVLPIALYYLEHRDMTANVLKANLILAMVTAGVIVLLFIAEKFFPVENISAILTKLLKEDHPLVSDLKHLARNEYIHALKVSTISKKCAGEIKADTELCAAAGFFYRIGTLEGEPIRENSLRLAYRYGFPEVLIQVLKEYCGQEQLPSSRESAIVHMVDACIRKTEVLNRNNLSTTWNQDMAVYQALNELSGKGIYDESGLSMNQFLRLRELLVREELGYDDHN